MTNWLWRSSNNPGRLGQLNAPLLDVHAALVKDLDNAAVSEIGDSSLRLAKSDLPPEALGRWVGVHDPGTGRPVRQVIGVELQLRKREVVLREVGSEEHKSDRQVLLEKCADLRA
jgi:hypothetical protein